MEFLDRIGIEPALDEAPMLGVEIVDGEGDVAVAVAVRVGLGAAVVQRQLDLEIVLGVAQIDQREAVEIEPVGDFRPKAAP